MLLERRRLWPNEHIKPKCQIYLVKRHQHHDIANSFSLASLRAYSSLCGPSRGPKFARENCSKGYPKFFSRSVACCRRIFQRSRKVKTTSSPTILRRPSFCCLCRLVRPLNKRDNAGGTTPFLKP